VSAQGMGGRQVRTDKKFGEIFDHHYVELTYSNGVRINSQCRHQKGCENPVREELTGTKGILYLTDADNGARMQALDYKGNVIWRYDRKKAAEDPTPYQTEHNELQDAILNGKKLNNAYYVAESTMTALMGRFATYSGKNIEWDAALKSDIQLMPSKVTWDTEPPTKPDADGNYPIAIPGVTKTV
jgi:predicted dehydrogenase